MAGRVHLGGFGGLSDRDYTEYQVVALQKPDRPDWNVSGSLEDQPVQLVFYEDAETGILVRNIAAYEQWLTRVPTFRGRDL